MSEKTKSFTNAARRRRDSKTSTINVKTIDKAVANNVAGLEVLVDQVFDELDKVMILDAPSGSEVPMIFGSIDIFTGTQCQGWAWVPGRLELHPSISIAFGDITIATTTASLFRRDLRSAGMGEGFYGFHITFPFEIGEAALPSLGIEARVSGDSQPVMLQSPSMESAFETVAEHQLRVVNGLIDQSVLREVDSSIDHELNLEAFYLLNGRFNGAAPNALFDPSFYTAYAEANYGWDVSATDALVDYVNHGEEQGARPHPIFDPAFVATALGKTRSGGVLKVFLSLDERERPAPSHLFWPDWYAQQYKLQGDPLTHYLKYGIPSGLDPNPLLSVLEFALRYGVAVHDAVGFYVLHERRHNLTPHILFDPEHVRRQLKSYVAFQKGTALEGYFASNHDIDPHPLFDTRYYRSTRGSDIESKFPLLDYLAQPRRDLRPHPLFWDSEYRRERPDVDIADLNPLSHYCNSGNVEHVRTHPLIDHDYLCAQLGEPRAELPLLTYLNQSATNMLSPTQEAAPESRIARSWHRCVFYVDPTKAPKVKARRIGLFAHIYYADLTGEIAALANNLPEGASIYVSTDSTAKADQIEAVLRRLCHAPVEVRVLPNRGRDIAPFLVGFADRIKEVDIGLHVHTKKSPHYRSSFDGWRKYLFTELAGSPEIVAGNLALLDQPEIGMVAPIDFAPIDALLNWGGNRPVADKLIRAMGGELTQGSTPELPSGSMFWFKSAALQPFLSLNLTFDHFDPEKSQVDGTLAHAVERCFFYIGELAGFKFVRTTTHAYIEGMTVTRSRDLTTSQTLPSAWRHAGKLERYHPETASFVASRASGAPRLNLLIPTADMSVGYAGVSEAIRLFRGTLAYLGDKWDGRIIMTDVPPNNMFIPPDGYRLVDGFRASEKAHRAVVSACARNEEFLTLRSNDVFMASAWWNAGQAFDLIRQADDLFGDAERSRKLLYLIQDDERGFNAWSTKFQLCNDTYAQPDQTFAAFNTPFLHDHFASTRLIENSVVYEPPINKMLAPAEVLDWEDRDKIVLLYARPHAQRNALDFIDAVVSECITEDEAFWKGWRWLAIGEDFEDAKLLNGSPIEIAGRLTLSDYKALLATARLGVSLMISPHPSYPPLEMAANGIRVVTNVFESRDLAGVHSNITTFSQFDPAAVASLLKARATADEDAGKSRIEWFFDGKTNASHVFEVLATEADRQASRSKVASTVADHQPPSRS